MADKNLSSPKPDGWEVKIPDGWEVRIEYIKDGSQIPCYWCPRSGQHFFSYDEMMRYIDYATKYQLSIYSEEFQTIKLRKRADWSHKGNRTTVTPRRLHFLGESSKTLPSYRVTSPEESSDLEESTTMSMPEDSTEFTDVEMIMEASQAGIDKEPQNLSSYLEALINVNSDE